MLVHVSHHEQQILSGIKWFGPHQIKSQPSCSFITVKIDNLRLSIVQFLPHFEIKRKKNPLMLVYLKKNNNNEISVLYSGRG